MKPLYLKMTAFGSYGGEEFIDFQKTTQNLFLITGDTGAGKTTIFDAMVFALYGEASSNTNRKSGLILQSQFAPENAIPRVEFAFEEIEDGMPVTYKVIRRPEYMRPAKKKLKSGATMIKESGKVELILPDGSSYEKEKKVDQKIAEIIGLNKSQFMQVGMIAQGEFMELLRANSDTKKEIFRKLFHTELYEKMVEVLLQRKRKKVGELAAIKSSIKEIVKNVKLPEAYEFSEEYQALYQDILDEKITRLPEYVEALERLSSYCKEEQDKIDEKWNRIRDDLIAKRSEYTASKQWWDIYTEYEKALHILKECQEEEEKMALLSEHIKNVKKALEILPYEKQLQDAVSEEKETAAKKESYEKSYPEAVKAWENAVKEQEICTRKYDEQQAIYLQIEQKVKDANTIFTELSVGEKKKEEYKATLSKLSKKKEEKENLQKDLLVKEENARTKRKQYSNAEVEYQIYEEEEKKFQDKESSFNTLKEEEQLIEEMKNQLSKKMRLYNKSADAYDAMDKNYRDLDRAFLDAQVGILAEKLEDGEPCPVCGSLHHPAPSHHKEDAIIPTQQEVEDARTERDHRYELMKNIAGDIKADRERLRIKEETYEKELETLRLFFGADSKERISSAMLERKEALSEEGKKRADAVTEYQNAGKDEEEFSSQEKICRDELAAIMVDYSEAEKNYYAQLQLLQSLEEKKIYPTQEEANQAMEEATKIWDEIKEQKAAFDLLVNQSFTEKQRQKTEVEHYTETLPIKKQKVLDQQEEYAAIIKAKGFDSEEAWKSLATKEEENALETRMKALDDYEKKYTKARLQKESNEKHLHLEEGKKAPLEQIQLEVDTLVDKEAILQKEKNTIHTMYTANEDALSRLKEGWEKREKCVKEHNLIHSLYDRIAGRTSGDHKIDLETFVQRYYLEQILIKANRRFEKLSAGQFRLMLKDIEEAGKGKNEGLDLMVYSMVTGKRREIRSLSGGESFMAALSLALGMADQIQEQSSVLQLDMMFIDEGFGSLDERSRNQAIRILKEMAGGNKLIGIISHVSELKQEMENQLVIKKDDRGSHTSWQIN